MSFNFLGWIGLLLHLGLTLVVHSTGAHPQQLSPGDHPPFRLTEQTMTASLSSATPTAAEISGLEDLMRRLGGPISINVLSSSLPRATQLPESSSTNPPASPQAPQPATPSPTPSTYLESALYPSPTPASGSSGTDDSKSGAPQVSLHQVAFTVLFCTTSAAVGLWLI